MFDPNTPSIARVYDHILGGKDNFAADRELADRLLTLVPLIAEAVIENRRFLSRAVTWAAASQGISQFIDLGCGIPTAPNTHESAQAVIGDARIAYVDNDRVVVNHLHAKNVVISVLHAAESEAADEGLTMYRSTTAPVYSHPLPAVASFFGPLELVSPGVVEARQWRPDWP